MAGIDYRQLQAPEQVDTNLPDSGAAARAAELRRTFQEFEGLSGDIYAKSATKAGAIAGAASGDTGHPDYKKGLQSLTVYGRAFNNAATGSYAIQAEAQADDTAARLRVEANNDPEHFRATYSAVRDAAVKNAPPEAQGMLAELYNRRLAQGLAAISADAAASVRDNARNEYNEGIARKTSQVALLQGSENPQDQLAAQDEHAKLSLMIDGGVTAGLYDKATAQAMQVNAMRQITAQVFSTQVDRELAKPDGDVGALMERFRLAHIADLKDTSKEPTLSEAEYQKLYADATTKIREQRLLDMLTKGEYKTAEQMRWDQGDKDYTTLLLQGKLTDSALASAVATGNLRPETARALRTQLAAGPVIKSDPKALLNLLHDPRLPGMSDAEIAATPGISNSDKIAVGKEAERQRNNWEGSQQVKDGIQAISAALKVPPGSFLVSDDRKMAVQNATIDYKARLSKLPPEERLSAAPQVAQDVIRDERRREAAGDVQRLTFARDSTLRDHGPGSADEWTKDKMDAYLKRQNDRIAVAQAQAKGP